MKNRIFFTSDIETKGGLSGSWLLGSIYDGRNYFEFTKESEYMNFLLGLKGTVFFHYGGEFDFRFILNWMSKKNLKLSTPILKDKKLIELRIKGKEVVFRDSFALLDSSLENLIKQFKTKTNKTKIRNYDFQKITPIVRKHLKADTIALYEVLKVFYDFIGWKFFTKKTISSIALAKFKEISPDKYKKIIENPLYFNAYDFVKKAYFSSYYHIFQDEIKYRKKTIKLDINSFFPAIMKSNEFPVGRHFTIQKENDIIKYIQKGYLGIVEVEGKIPLLKFGFLPKKTKDEVEYPVKGKIKGLYTTPEIIFAQNLGYQFQFKKAIFWMENDYLFKDFIENLYQLRRKNKGIKEQIIKRAMVSFYGKFAQKRDLEIVKSYEFPQAHKVCLNREFNLYPVEQYRYMDFSHPELSIFTTSYSRIFLYQRMEEIKFENIISVMIDSLIINVSGLDKDFRKKWIDKKELGKFKIVIESDKYKPIIFGRGIYSLKNNKGQEIVRNQGGDRRFNKTLKYKDFEMVLKNRTKSWTQYTEKDNLKRLVSVSSFLKGKTKGLREMKKLKRTVKINKGNLKKRKSEKRIVKIKDI